ncbi:unnamed protein product [Hanseniaspora opuntiae]
MPETHNLSDVGLEEILELSYLETANGVLYQCIATSTRFLLYRDSVLVDAHYFNRTPECKQRIKIHVYTSQNTVVFIKNNTFETWKVYEDTLKLSNSTFFEDANDLNYVFQDIVDTDNKGIKTACLVGYLGNIFRVWQTCFDSNNDESYIVFQQSMWVENKIDDLCVFPVDTSSLDFSACAIRMGSTIKLITISMLYISNAQRYLNDTVLIKKVEDMKLGYKVDGGDPITFNNLKNIERNKLKNSKTLILNYKEAIMGSYYLNLNYLYSGELPRHIDDLKIANSFSKYKKTCFLSRELQDSFISILDNKDDFRITDCCLIQHANSMVSVMFYNNNLINVRDPYFVNLTFVKDMKNFMFLKDSVFRKLNILLYVGNKVRSGTINDITKVFKDNEKLANTSKRSTNDKRRKAKVKTYANIDNLYLLIKILPFECNQLHAHEGKVSVESSYKKLKIVNEEDTKQSNQYMFSVNSNFKNHTIFTNILGPKKHEMSIKGFIFIESLQGYLYLESSGIDQKILMSLNLLFYKDGKWINRNLIPKLHKKVPMKFDNIDKINVKFMSNIYNSNEVTGLLSYVDANANKYLYFTVTNDNEFFISYQLDVDHLTTQGQNCDYNITTQYNSILHSKIETRSEYKHHTENKNVIILGPEFFNAEMDIFWIISETNLQVVIFDKVSRQEMKFWTHMKSQTVSSEHWMNKSKWSINSDGSKCVYSSDGNLMMFEIAEEYFYDINITDSLKVNVIEANTIINKYTLFIDIDFQRTVIGEFFIDEQELKVETKTMSMDVAQSTLTPIDNKPSLTPNDVIFSVITEKIMTSKQRHSFKVMVGYKSMVTETGCIAEYDMDISL